jgi:hypothetical protein
VSKINDIKEQKRQQRQVTPTAILSEPIEEGVTNKEKNVGRKDRKKTGVI